MTSSIFSQNNYIVKMWERTTGLPDTIDWSASCRDGSQNTYITGNTYEIGEKANIITTKYNASGDEVWQVEYNSSSNDNDYGIAIEVDGSGNVYVAAASFTSGTNYYDYRVIKYNSSGTEQWNVTYNGPGNFYDIPTNIMVDTYGNVYVTGGSTGSGTLFDYCTIKYNASGTQQWVSRYNYNDNDDFPGGLAINSQGKILVTGGSAQATDNWDFASIKYDPISGSQLDAKRNTASGLGVDRVFGLAIDGADNLYIAGRAAVSGQGYNMKVVKLDSLLNTTWSKTYDLATKDDEAHGVVVDYLNNVYITGYGTTADGAKNMITRKYSSSGALLWSKQEAANNGGELDAEATDMALEEYGDIYVTGKVNNGANTDFMTVIYNTSGDKLWTEVYDGAAHGDDTPYFVNADTDNQFYVGGKVWNGTNYTYKLIRYKKSTYILPPDDDPSKPASFTFFENKGQLINTNDDAIDYIKYYTNRHYPSLYLDDDTLHYVFSNIDTNTTTDDTLSRIAMTFYNSSTSKFIHHAESKEGEYLNYFLAHTGSQGVTNVHHYDRLYATEVYPYVDVMYYFDNGGLKYYLIIKPGYNPQANPIQLKYDGATTTILTGNKLKLETDIGELIQKSPDAYQISASGTLISLGWDATYTSVSGRTGFTLGTYDATKVLVLEISLDMLMGGGGCEPNVIWGTYYQGGEEEILSDVKINGNSFDYSAYVSGTTTTSATEFPSELNFINDLSGSRYDLFIQKFNLKEDDLSYDKYEARWGTYVGGSNNENLYLSSNCQLGIGVNGKLIYFTGITFSDDLPDIDDRPTDPDNLFDDDLNSTYDGCAGYLSSEGDLLWLSYIGGASGSTVITEIKTKDQGGFIVTGFSSGGTDFPLYDPTGSMPYSSSGKKGFIIEADVNHHLQMSTLFGSSIYDVINDVDINSDGDIIICGNTSGTTMPVTTGACDATFAGVVDIFIAKIHPDGTDRDLEWCTYYGGAGTDRARAMTIDEDNNIYVTGETYNYGITTAYKFPLIDAGEYFDDEFTETSAGEHKGFILRTDVDGNCDWATLFGGSSYTYCRDITSDGHNIYVVGNEEDAEGIFPLDPSDYIGVYYDDVEGINDATSFLSMFNKNTSLRWCTFLGDEAHNGAVATTINTEYADELYIVGFFSNSVDYSGYLPLCDPGGDAFYDESDIGSLNHGFINGFDVSMFEDIGTFTSELQTPASFEIYPNPSYHSININSANQFLYDINVYDIQGNLIHGSYNNNGVSIIDVSAFSEGVYLLKIESELGTNNYLFEKL
jgi:hypothetical protein